MLAGLSQALKQGLCLHVRLPHSVFQLVRLDQQYMRALDRIVQAHEEKPPFNKGNGRGRPQQKRFSRSLFPIAHARSPFQGPQHTIAVYRAVYRMWAHAPRSLYARTLRAKFAGGLLSCRRSSCLHLGAQCRPPGQRAAVASRWNDGTTLIILHLAVTFSRTSQMRRLLATQWQSNLHVAVTANAISAGALLSPFNRDILATGQWDITSFALRGMV